MFGTPSADRRGSARSFGRASIVGIAASLAIAAAAVSLGASAAAGHAARAHAAYGCPQPAYSPRDPRNPLGLASAPGADPLRGASLFVDGPRHGAAAGAIAQALGLDPTSFPDGYSWASLRQAIDSPAGRARLNANPGLAHEVRMLEKIAREPETQRFSAYSGGGGPGAVYAQVVKLFCYNLTADPGSIPVFSTFFLHPALGGCATPSQVIAAGPVFRRRVDEVAAATGNRPAVYLLEIDAIGSSSCMVHSHALPYWEADLRYEVDKLSALPHTVVYLEGGYSDSNSPSYTAKVLNASGIRQARGFFTNDTHENWTLDEINWAQKVSRMTHGAHFIVNTANNGHGPLRPRNRVKNGNEVLCNPPGRGLGPRPTTSTGFKSVDAFLWTSPPGNSSGSCNGGPASGTFWPAKAIAEASRANGRLGPRYPSRPY
jgi:endoglucanase